MSVADQLEVPEAASADEVSFELLRVWITNDTAHVTLRTSVWRDPAVAWGVMFVDLAKSIATSHEREAGVEPNGPGVPIAPLPGAH